MAWIQPLDLESLFVNTLTGSNDIFIGLAIVAMAGLAAYFRMPNDVALMLMALFFVIMSPFIGSGIMVLIIIITTLMVYFTVGKLFKN